MRLISCSSSHMLTAAVGGVVVVVFSDTSVTVSWNVLDISIDYYTVVYSRVSQQQNEEMSAVFSSPATSGVILLTLIPQPSTSSRSLLLSQ